MEILRIDAHALQCRDADSVWLGFITGIPVRNFRSFDTLALRNSAGMLVCDGDVVPWAIERFIEFEGGIAALGPWVPDTCLWEPPSAAALGSGLSRLLPAINAISKRGFELKGFLPMAFRTLVPEGILVCPLKLAEKIRRENIEDKNVVFWQHPDINVDGEKSWLFFLGLLTWKTLTGQDPFKNAKEELRRERIRRGIFPHIMGSRPGTNPALARLIQSALACGTRRHLPESHQNHKPALREWLGTAPLWQQETSAPPENRQAATSESQKLAKIARRNENRFRLRLKIRRWGWPFLTFALLLGLGFGLLGLPLKKWIQGPVTAGLSPLEISWRFYQAINEMDVETMRDCLARKTGRNDLRMVELLYVTNRIRLGMEGHNTLVEARNWLASGRPPLPEGTSVWGITDLKIRSLPRQNPAAPGDTETIEARYQFWFPSPPPDNPETSAPAHPVPLTRKDILHLALGRRAWKIIAIERDEEQETYLIETNRQAIPHPLYPANHQ